MEAALKSILRWLQHPLVRLVITAFCLWLLFRGMHGKHVLSNLLTLQWPWLLGAVACTTLMVAGAVLVWGLLLRANGHRLAWLQLFSLYSQGLFWGHILPGGVGGEAVRVVKTARFTGEGPALASLAASRLLE